MAIQIRGNKFSIRYNDRGEDGVIKSFRISNPSWTLEVGKRYMKQIEATEIQKDKERRKRTGKGAREGSLSFVADEFVKWVSGNNKEDTVLNKKSMLMRIVRASGPDLAIAKVFLPEKLGDIRSEITSKEDLTTKRRNKYLETMRQFADFCALREYITETAYDKAKRILRSLKVTEAPTESEVRCWTKEEWEKFIATFSDDDPWRMFFELTYWAALRMGESLALLASDFSKSTKTVSVTKSLDKQCHVVTPKTKSSVRKVDLPSSVVDDLEGYIARLRIAPSEPLFFPDRRTSRTTVARVMEEHQKKAGVREIPPHGLRHSCATRLLLSKDEAGQPVYDITYVSHHLGHASIAETMKVYINYLPNAYKGIMDKA